MARVLLLAKFLENGNKYLWAIPFGGGTSSKPLQAVEIHTNILKHHQT